MIDPAYCVTMARYNAWQNNGIRSVVKGMDQSQLRQDRGAFFGAIFGTLNHLLWADQLWMSRFDGGEAPAGGIDESVQSTANAEIWDTQRAKTDKRINDWAASVTVADLSGSLRWFSFATGGEFEKSASLCVVHFFNHQTHHRGQVHAMLTAANENPGDTDLFLMPADVDLL